MGEGAEYPSPVLGSPLIIEPGQSIYLGQQISEVTLKKGLRELNPGFHFDMATKLGFWHPRQAAWQGVYYQGQHVCSMDRNDDQMMVPEMSINQTEKFWDIEKKEWVHRILRQLKIGWRPMFWRINNKHIPNATYSDLCKKFGVPEMPHQAFEQVRFDNTDLKLGL